MFDFHHNNISFVVDSASPESIIPAATYLDQAEDGSNIFPLFASDGHPLEEFGTINLLLNFEHMLNHYVLHTFLVADAQCSVLAYDFLSKHSTVKDIN